ncbi:MAG: ABC transporter permease [Nocardioidaceae bacterium]|nr:ABC transporter permease [Nocardioidaceae bacterium]
MTDLLQRPERLRIRPRVRRRTARRRMTWSELATYGAVLVLLVLAVVGPWIAPHDPYLVDQRNTLLAPSGEHWLGTDGTGRDLFSRLLAGARPSIIGAVVTVLAAATIGVVVAAIAATAGRVVDGIVMRICEVVLSLPVMMTGLGLAVALGPSQKSAVIALILASWPSFARLARSEIRRVMVSPHVEAAQVLGVSRWRLLTKHVLPNSLDTVYVKAAMDVGGVIVIISSLSFIGAGAQAPSAEWGAMVESGSRFLNNAWWVTGAPGLAILVTSAAFSLAGDALRARLDPMLSSSLGEAPR